MGEVICHHNGRYNIYGTCSDGFLFWESLEEFLSCNRMGVDERPLPYKECIRIYLSERKG
jgi:hypothetical protein